MSFKFSGLLIDFYVQNFTREAKPLEADSRKDALQKLQKIKNAQDEMMVDSAKKIEKLMEIQSKRKMAGFISKLYIKAASLADRFSTWLLRLNQRRKFISRIRKVLRVKVLCDLDCFRGQQMQSQIRRPRATETHASNQQCVCSLPCRDSLKALQLRQFCNLMKYANL